MGDKQLRARTDGSQCLVNKGLDGPGFLSQGDLAEQVMGNTLPLMIRQLVGDDGQALVDLHGVAIDDLAIVTAGEIHSKLSSVGQPWAEKGVEKDRLTWDLPVPVEPMMVTRGHDGGTMTPGCQARGNERSMGVSDRTGWCTTLGKAAMLFWCEIRRGHHESLGTQPRLA